MAEYDLVIRNTTIATAADVVKGDIGVSAGRVVALEESLWDLDDAERERFRLRYCGFVFQGYNLFPALTARQQLPSRRTS